MTTYVVRVLEEPQPGSDTREDPHCEACGRDHLHVREWGKPTDIEILPIHGWSQSHRTWPKQCEELAQKGHRIVALDLRGHGMSGAPLQAGQYMDGNKWADDIAAIIDQVALEKPILVGWS